MWIYILYGSFILSVVYYCYTVGSDLYFFFKERRQINKNNELINKFRQAIEMNTFNKSESSPYRSTIIPKDNGSSTTSNASSTQTISATIKVTASAPPSTPTTPRTLTPTTPTTLYIPTSSTTLYTPTSSTTLYTNDINSKKNKSDVFDIIESATTEENHVYSAPPPYQYDAVIENRPLYYVLSELGKKKTYKHKNAEKNSNNKEIPTVTDDIVVSDSVKQEEENLKWKKLTKRIQNIETYV